MLSSASLRAGMQETLLDGAGCSEHPDSPLTSHSVNEEERQNELSLPLTMSYSLMENPKHLLWDPDEKGS